MAEPNSHDMILGEMRGQLREVVHGLNNLSAKVDSVSREVIGLGPLAAEIATMKERLALLETDKNRKEGAAGVLHAIFKSPALAWLISAAVTAWALLTGKVNV